MAFQSWIFFAFLIAVLAAYWTVVPSRYRPGFLLASGLACYAYYDELFGVGLILYVYLSHLIATQIERRTGKSKKFMLVLGILLGVGLLLFYKARLFFYELLLYLILPLGFRPVNLPLSINSFFLSKVAIPIGISYFTFRAIHYLIEVYRGKFRNVPLLDFSLYITFFPTIICGPIERFENFTKQRAADKRFDPGDLLEGSKRILIGFAKKLFIANTAYNMVTPFLFKPTELSTWQLWLMMHLYYLYIYVDFSGYSDIAIGISRLFGYRIMENFNWPILAKNIREFWQRWHISLSRWVMEYIYFALGGGRRSPVRVMLNLFVAMIIMGFWHGADWHHIIWGFYMGLGLVVFRTWDRFKKRTWPEGRPQKWYWDALGIFMTIQFMNFGWPLLAHKTDVAFLTMLKLLGVPL